MLTPMIRWRVQPTARAAPPPSTAQCCQRTYLASWTTRRTSTSPQRGNSLPPIPTLECLAPHSRVKAMMTKNGIVMATGTPGGVAGNYSFSSTVLGYGSITGVTGLGSIHKLGLYATDPTLNLLDPNNTTAANLGAALVLDLDDFAQGTGIVVPQGTIASDGSDLNHSYGFGAQAFPGHGSSPAGNPGWEFDLVGQGTFASRVFTTATGGPPTPVDISDPFASFISGTADEYTAVPIAGTAAAPDAAGRYTFPSATRFAVGPVGGAVGPTVDFTVVLYEAGPGLVFSINEDVSSSWLGSFQEQSAGSLETLHVKRGPLVEGQAKPNR